MMLKKFLFTFVALFIAFALFTAFAPCKYSSMRSVEQRLGWVAHAAVATVHGDKIKTFVASECNCNTGYNSGCQYADGCTIHNTGCGFLWIMECNGCDECPVGPEPPIIQ